MKVLVADDSLTMRMLVKMLLNQIVPGELHIYEAENGSRALEIVRNVRLDLVLSDWKMPQMTGLELLQNMKKEGIDYKFGFITSEGTPEMRELALKNGALFLLHKPFNLQMLKDELSKVITI